MPLAESIADSLRLSEPHASAAQVHLVVANALSRIAPDVVVRTTDYFTHSFVPDLIVGWGVNGERTTRHVHLRFGLAGATFRDDVELLADSEPIFLGLGASPPMDPRLVGGAKKGTSGTLVTQAAAIDAMDDGRLRNRRAVSATREVVRGGRGALSVARASEVVGAFERALGAIDDLERSPTAARAQTKHTLKSFELLLRPREFASMERNLRARWLLVGGDPFEFPSQAPWDPGSLTTAELGEVLNALLDSGRRLSSKAWVRNAGGVTAEGLAEVLAEDRRGGSLNDLAVALLPAWTAQWASIERSSLPLSGGFEWIIRRATLGVQLGDLTIFFRDDGRRFMAKAPSDDPLPTVQQCEGLLRDADVLAAQFGTPDEGIEYQLRALGAESLYERAMAKLTDSLDELRLEVILTRVPGRDHAALVDLAREIINTQGNPTAVSVLIRLAHRYFARSAEAWPEVEAFLRGDVAPDRSVG
jgi:hypothetical protein